MPGIHQSVWVINVTKGFRFGRKRFKIERVALRRYASEKLANT